MPDGDAVHFELSASQEEDDHRWAAIGFSMDEFMVRKSSPVLFSRDNNAFVTFWSKRMEEIFYNSKLPNGQKIIFMYFILKI